MLRNFVLAAVLVAAAAHICLISPQQRGVINVIQPGDDSCFRHKWPCGGQDPSPAPYPTYPAYEYENYFQVSFQQNLNHYEVGYPGYIDVAYTRNLNPTNESDFTTIYTLSDPNYHMQSKQTNFTLYVEVPKIDCPHCILRTRYVPHKPGEATFYQCADVAFKKPKARAAPSAPAPVVPEGGLSAQAERKRARLDAAVADSKPIHENHTHLQFLIHDWFNGDASNLYLVDTVDGSLTRRDFYPFGIRRRDTRTPATAYALDQIFAFDNTTNTSYYMVHETGDWEAVPAMLVRVQNGDIHLRSLSSITAPINGIVLRDSSHFVALMIVEVPSQPGYFQLAIASLDPITGAVHELQRTTADDTFINFQWLELDPTRKFLYVLMGDENSLFELRTTLFVFDLDGNTYRSVRPNVTRFTFSAFHVQSSGQIYALSPGLHKAGSTTPASAWWLVTLDPNTGAVAPVFEVSTPGLFFPHYSQAVFNCPDGVIYARLDMQDDDGLSVVVTVNVAARTTHFSSQTILDLAHNLAYVGY